MKVWINLLPEEKKKIVQKKHFDRFLFRQAVLFLSVAVFYLAVLGVVFFIVRENRLFTETVTSQRSTPQQESDELIRYESAFRDANMLAAQVNRFRGSRPDWTGFLLRLDRLVPKNVYMGSITTKENRIFLSGTAATRDDFLALESSLRGDDCLADFQIPVSNLFSEKNVVFQMDFTVKPSCLIGT
ncbi:MAG TPA: PilN domain-containing protein [Candidatus Fimivivens sp.]|nr:PilN domain-containing protein [Candidatus Fimivivens sp.]